MSIVSKAQHYAKQTLSRHLILVFAFIVLFSLSVSTLAKQDKSLEENSDRVNALLEAVKSEGIGEGLTDPNEIKAILGEPQREYWYDDGAIRGLVMIFPMVEVFFSR